MQELDVVEADAPLRLPRLHNAARARCTATLTSRSALMNLIAVGKSGWFDGSAYMEVPSTVPSLAGGLTLEESLTLWERGEELANLCQHWLDRARERLAAAVPADDAGRD